MDWVGVGRCNSPDEVFGIEYDNEGASEYGAEVVGSVPAPIVALVNGGFGRGPVGVVVLVGEPVLALAAAACDFFRCAAGLER